MTHRELIRRLIAEVPSRIGRYHKDPSSMYLTEEEASELAKTFPIAVCLQAMRSMCGVLHHDPTASRERVIKAIHNVAHRLLMEGKAKGFYREFSGTDKGFKQQNKVHDVPTPAPTPTGDADAETVLDMREEFQNQATQQDWTLTEDQAIAFLRQAGSADVMREAIQKLPKYSANDFEAALSELSAAIDQVLWMRAASALTHQ